jgi:hypothetical protein
VVKACNSGIELATECALEIVEIKYLFLTQQRRAGMGVQFLKWIMASKLGRCPSLAPEKHNLERPIKI